MLDEAALAFVRERHLATLTTMLPSGALHVCAVGFTFDPEANLVRVITSDHSRKVRNVDSTPDARAAVGQVDGPRWLSLEGPARVRREPNAVADAVSRYERRYRTPRVNPARVVIEITVERVRGRATRSAG